MGRLKVGRMAPKTRVALYPDEGTGCLWKGIFLLRAVGKMGCRLFF